MTTAIRDAVHRLDAAHLMRLLPARPRLLALGEPTHGEETLLEIRNNLFRQLVAQAGYRTIAVESDCVMGLVVDDYVVSGAGDLDEVMERGFSHGWGAHAGNRELVRWMRSFNEGRPAAEQVRFAGFDGPLEFTGAAAPRQSLSALHAYLAAWIDVDLLPCTAEDLDRLLGEDGRWTNHAAMMTPSQSVGQTSDARELRLLAGELAALVEDHVPQLSRASGAEELDRARLYARTAVGLLRYHWWLADDSVSRMARLLGVRDSMMAANLTALAQRGPTLVYAHNTHLQREKSSMRMWQGRFEWWGAGAVVSERLGADYAFVATALGTIEHQGVDTPPPDSVEGVLYGLDEQACLVEPQALAAALCETRLAGRVSPWFGYAPMDPERWVGYDGIVFVRDAAAPAR